MKNSHPYALKYQKFLLGFGGSFGAPTSSLAFSGFSAVMRDSRLKDLIEYDEQRK